MYPFGYVTAFLFYSEKSEVRRAPILKGGESDE